MTNRSQDERRHVAAVTYISKVEHLRASRTDDHIAGQIHGEHVGATRHTDRVRRERLERALDDIVYMRVHATRHGTTVSELREHARKALDEAPEVPER